MNTETQTDSNITNNKDQRNIFISLIVLVVVACIVVFQLVGATPITKQVYCMGGVELCNDGSAVVRTGPNCDFAPCPNDEIYRDTERSMTELEAQMIAESSCVKGGEMLGRGMYNGGTRTWWFDANLNATREGCNPACVVSEDTGTAEINWRCTGAMLPPTDPDPVACTMDAKICPDGSAVGRTGPNCEFAPCPTTQEPDEVTAILNQTVDSKGLSINPLEVTEDSRCPIDAQCIQAGTARVAVELEFGNEVEFRVFEVGVPVDVANDTLILTLKDVSPFPQISRDISLSEYVFTFLVVSQDAQSR